MVVSIVIPVHNGLEFTKQCLESIRRNTPKGRYEIIVIDNGSNKETHTYLSGCTDINLFTNATNEGFAKAINRGITQTSGEYIFILNNDTILFPKWLERMTAAFSDDVGAVGPVSNYVMGKQRAVVARQSATPQQIHNIISTQYQGQVEETDLLIGFALMISRKALQKVGTLDEAFFAGSEDLDYSLRLRRAGFKLKIAMDVFVYHRGGSTSKQILNKHDEFLQQGIKIFCEKWSKELGTNITGHRQAFDVALGAKQPLLTVATIVKNEGRLMKNMLKVTNSFCDDFCIVDTGSTDGTVDSLKTLLLNNGKILQYQWNDNFSEARNFGLPHCRGKWILQLDADEVIDRRYASVMKRLLEQNECDALRFTIVNFREDPFLIEDPKVDKLTAIRMWRNDKRICYQGIVHETVAESVTKAGFKIAESPVPIFHFAYLKSPKRYFELMKKATAIDPTRSNGHYFLGEHYIMRGELSLASKCFQNAIATASVGKDNRDYIKRVRLMLDITEATLAGRDLQRFPQDVRDHFEVLRQV